MKVDWSKVPSEFDWVTGDIYGLIYWENKPAWDYEIDGFFAPGELMFAGGYIGNTFARQRPTESDTNA